MKLECQSGVMRRAAKRRKRRLAGASIITSFFEVYKNMIHHSTVTVACAVMPYQIAAAFRLVKRC